jgi:acyl carrier protein
VASAEKFGRFIKMDTVVDVMEKMKQLISEVAGNPELAENIDGSTDIINDIGLDSIQMINLVLLIEDEFEIQIDFEDFDFFTFSSIKALSDYIVKNMEGSVAS